jgi:pimeloyl-ACP methyl ester carboxylesterase
MRGPRDESTYRERSIRGARYLRSRRRFGDVQVFVKRFPGSGGDLDFVLVHGIGVSSRYFHPLAVELAKLGRVWLVDLPGYGDAPDPHRDVTLDDHAEALHAFIVDAGIGPHVLVGHSMGTQVVTSFALAHPELVDELVLLAPTMPPEARTPMRAIGRLLHDGLRETWHVRWVTVSDYLIRCGPPYILRQLPHLLDDRLEDRLPHLSVRTTVVVGDRDPIVPGGWAQRCADAAGAPLVVLPGPHVIMHTAPVETAALIRERVA